jgi:acetoacetate decarboxylase
LRGKFRFNDDYVYKMPVHFGGYPFYPVRTEYGDMTSISVKYETEQEALLQLIPEDFELRQPLVSVQFANCRDVDWMAGGEYRLIQVTAPVRYLGNSEGLVGEYVFVIWENHACAIIGGREEDGMPKVFADISAEHHVGSHWYTSASYENNNFLKVDFLRKSELCEKDVNEINKDYKTNYFGWRYLPNLGKGGATLSHATLYPQEMMAKRVWACEGGIQWTKLTQEQHPLQFKIISTLADLPILKHVSVAMAKGTARLNVGDSRILP